MPSQFKTPILFLIFNRPDVTRRVFAKIRSVRPAYLFIAADGARSNRPGEAELCAETRAIASNVDWPCEVKTKFNDYNWGCKLAVSSAISWFFEHVENGIILEDDCLPEASFFSFCETMLTRFANESRIMHISGDNFQKGARRGEGDCYYSIYNHIWGWATWRRAWKFYDVDMKSYNREETIRVLRSLSCSRNFQDYWGDIFEKVAANGIDTWDYQWTHAMWMQRGLAVLPQENLISNIGFSIDATHTTSTSWQANLTTTPLKVTTIPSAIEANRFADRFTAKNVYGIISNNVVYLFRVFRTKLQIRSRFRRVMGL